MSIVHLHCTSGCFKSPLNHLPFNFKIQGNFGHPSSPGISSSTIQPRRSLILCFWSFGRKAVSGIHLLLGDLSKVEPSTSKQGKMLGIKSQHHLKIDLFFLRVFPYLHAYPPQECILEIPLHIYLHIWLQRHF